MRRTYLTTERVISELNRIQKDKQKHKNYENSVIVITYYDENNGQIKNLKFPAVANKKWLNYCMDILKDNKIDINQVLQIARTSQI